MIKKKVKLVFNMSSFNVENALSGWFSLHNIVKCFIKYVVIYSFYMSTMHLVDVDVVLHLGFPFI